MVRELVEMVVPAFEHMEALVVAMREAEGGLKAEVVEAVERSGTAIEALMSGVMGQARLFDADVVELLGPGAPRLADLAAGVADGSRGAPGGEDAADPRLVTRGSH